jgi:four helix bundle protein
MIGRKGYKDLTVWQKAMDLAVAVYEITEEFPQDEKFGLVSQMRRAAVSIPSNIAEGSRRKGVKDTRHFFILAFSSGAELETQVQLVKRLSLGKKLEFHDIDELLKEIMKMLNKMTN